MASKVEKQVEELTERVLAGTEYELVDVEYKKEGNQWYLRVYIDHPDGIGLDDCEQVSRKLSDLLDEKDPIPHSYNLEVSSPGIERPLKKDADFERFAGYKVVANTFAPINGKKSFTGKLLGLEGDAVAIFQDNQKVLIPRDKISLIHLSVDI